MTRRRDSLLVALVMLAACAPGFSARPAQDHGAAAALARVYTPETLLWSQGGRVTSAGQALITQLTRAASYGLEPADYQPPPAPAAGADAAAWLSFDRALSALAVRFVCDLHYGRVDPATAGFHLEAAHHELDLAATLVSLARSPDPSAVLTAVEPPFRHYQLLKEALARYLLLAQQPDLTQVPAVPSHLKVGAAYAGAPALRRLLAALGDLPAGEALNPQPVFSAELGAAVHAFQLRHGLEADGLPGRATFAALTTPLARRVRQIDLTLERWRWLPPFQSPPIIVNIPQFRLFAFRSTEDKVADILQMDVIVGRVFPSMQTPVFESDMRYVVLRPYWDIPASITRNELLPKIRSAPGYLAAEHLEIVAGQLDSSPTVPPTPENLAALAAGKLRLRQQPGEDNALGLAKFIFPNAYNVYLHSTPAHQLFKETRRTFSHGCIRVSDPLALAAHVLRDSPDWDRDKIAAAMNGTRSVRVNLPQPVNVLILYGTALATEGGSILFFDDIYGYDAKLARDLQLPPVQ
jgi:L,D-transpeptidase YcbB